jgi:hypothetical protein
MCDDQSALLAVKHSHLNSHAQYIVQQSQAQGIAETFQWALAVNKAIVLH